MRRILLAFVALCAAACGDPASTPLQAPSWHEVRGASPERLQAVHAPGGGVIWASGTRGTYVRSTDGGTTWETGSVPEASDLEFRDVHAFGPRAAVLLSAGMGPASRIFRTRDAGASWDEVFRAAESTAFLDCLSFWDERRGVAFGDAIDGEFMVIVTEDGGDSWQRVPGDRLPDARPGEGAFAASGTCLVSGSGGNAWFGTGASGIDARVFRTSDHGRTWAASPAGLPSRSASSGVFTLAFLDDRYGLALGGDFSRPDTTFGDASVTEDGGTTWAPTGDPLLAGSVFGATFVPGAPTPTVVAVAPTGTSWSTDGARSWTRIDDANFWAVGASPDGRVWAVGPGGRIARLITVKP